MEEDAHASLADTSHSEYLKKCDIDNIQCFMDFYENYLSSKLHIIHLNRLNNIWKFCDDASMILTNQVGKST